MTARGDAPRRSARRRARSRHRVAMTIDILAGSGMHGSGSRLPQLPRVLRPAPHQMRRGGAAAPPPPRHELLEAVGAPEHVDRREARARAQGRGPSAAVRRAWWRAWLVRVYVSRHTPPGRMNRFFSRSHTLQHGARRRRSRACRRAAGAAAARAAGVRVRGAAKPLAALSAAPASSRLVLVAQRGQRNPGDRDDAVEGAARLVRPACPAIASSSRCRALRREVVPARTARPQLEDAAEPRPRRAAARWSRARRRRRGARSLRAATRRTNGGRSCSRAPM